MLTTLNSKLPKLDTQPLRDLEASLKYEKNTPDLRWESEAATHVGRVRSVNEDAFFQADDLRLWAVADGMGGLSRGHFASGAVIKALQQFSPQQSLAQYIGELENALIAINEKCRTAFRGKRCGTTIALLLEYGNHCIFLWAGDSRIYRLRDGQLKLMTVDHSLAQEKYLNGQLSFDEAITHPSMHTLTRAIGAHRTLRLEMRHDRVEEGDSYLICSDGLYNDYYSQEMEKILLNQPTEAALQALVDGALARGGKDNITAIVVTATAEKQTK